MEVVMVAVLVKKGGKEDAAFNYGKQATPLKLKSRFKRKSEVRFKLERLSASKKREREREFYKDQEQVVCCEAKW